MYVCMYVCIFIFRYLNIEELSTHMCMYVCMYVFIYFHIQISQYIGVKLSYVYVCMQVERTQTERTILANVRHPFIVCLHFAFQSPQKLYMVMDFVQACLSPLISYGGALHNCMYVCMFICMQGGDFFTLMRKFKRLPEDWARLYTMEIAMVRRHAIHT